MKPYLAIVSLLLLSTNLGASKLEAKLTLEKELACILPPSPAPTLALLVKEGFISPQPDRVEDSTSFFKVKGKLSVYGIPVLEVFGFDEDGYHKYKALFKRSPGTSPGTHIGIIPIWNKIKIKAHTDKYQILNLKLECSARWRKV